ncbi:MAG: DUF5694 domain-containing protein [Saprospiraceae bacterium]
MTYAQQNRQQQILKELDQWANAYVKEIDTKLESETIANYLIDLNSESTLNANLAFYTKYMAKIGKNESYIGTKLVVDWYSTNLHIYANILRQIKPTDKAIFVQFGQEHAAVLKGFFERNPDFEVVEVKELLE